MKRSVRLTLAKETLAALTSDDLGAVGAGADASVGTCYTCVECAITPVFHPSVFSPTECCQGIPTFHRAGAAC
ncbi:MAG TPA: hypothetical protein VGX28_11175 [Frankiaceae bacterium]|jgi:hypothetical protein|nr:hypothetical protein [Frankiaceae bacterium]